MNEQQKNTDLVRPGNRSTGASRLLNHFDEWQKALGYYSIFATLPILIAANSHEVRADDTVGGEQTIPRENGLSAKRKRLKPFVGMVPRTDYFQSSVPFLSGSRLNAPADCPGTPIPAGSYTQAAPYQDAGDTTGMGDTVTRVYYPAYYYYYYYNADAHGPDRIYSFVVTSTGDNPEISVKSASNSYFPMIYLTDGCPTGESNISYTPSVDDSRWGSDNIATVYLPYYRSLGQRYYLFVDSQMANEGGAYNLTIKDMQISTAVPVRANQPDFDGDGRSDLSVYRPSDATWYIDRSSGGTSATQFGVSTDKIVPQDYDGDGKTDVAIFRDGDWWILKSSDSTPEVIHFGQAGDIPVPADYSGDGRSELAVFRNGEWWIHNLVNGNDSVANFGQAGDKPVPGDYTRDGRTDVAVFRNGEWWILDLKTGQYSVINFGQAGDITVPGDYNGDSITDPAVYRDGTWHVSYWDQDHVFQWGLSSDVPTPGDYDGDGLTDMAIYRNGAWWIMQSHFGQPMVRIFGLGDDAPAPGAIGR